MSNSEINYKQLYEDEKILRELAERRLELVIERANLIHHRLGIVRDSLGRITEGLTESLEEDPLIS